MDLNTQRRCLGAIAGGLLVGTVGVIAWSLSELEQPSAASSAKRGIRPAAESMDEPPPPDDRFAARSLRGPLYDVAPPPPRPVQPPRPPVVAAPRSTPGLDVTLVGTIIEANQSFAILADSLGKFDIKGIGESLELTPPGMTLQSIESEQVTLRYQGRQSTLQLDRSTKKSSAGGVKSGTNRKRSR